MSLRGVSVFYLFIWGCLADAGKYLVNVIPPHGILIPTRTIKYGTYIPTYGVLK